MIKKTMFFLLASTLAMSYVRAQATVKDTIETGCMWVVDPITFQTTTGYLKRITTSELSYQRVTGSQNTDSIVYAKTKVPKSVNYYVISTIKGKDTWILVKVIMDWDMNLKLR